MIVDNLKQPDFYVPEYAEDLCDEYAYADNMDVLFEKIYASSAAGPHVAAYLTFCCYNIINSRDPILADEFLQYLSAQCEQL